MEEARLDSYAKINIGLKIVGKRSDGFHNIETIFYPVKLHDEIEISITPNENCNSVIITCSKYYVPSNKDNICFKAIEAFFTNFHITDTFKIVININKKIPVGGGLGGGSSNAAAVLKHLIRFFKIDIKEHRKKIMHTALSIGSDVPFFLIMKPCFGAGRGEQLRILPEFSIPYDILIINPNLHVSTKWAYENLGLEPDAEYPSGLREIKSFDVEKKELYVNDFERVVFQKYSPLKQIKDECIEFGAVFASMSGSGATMYAFFNKDDKRHLNRAYRHFKEKEYFVNIS
jgi:4-diphosphocytidyl-2-C-methyl-D-erythritol kinase